MIFLQTMFVNRKFADKNLKLKKTADKQRQQGTYDKHVSYDLGFPVKFHTNE